MLTDITDDTQTKHDDYNFLNKQATKQILENYPLKCIVSIGTLWT